MLLQNQEIMNYDITKRFVRGKIIEKKNCGPSASELYRPSDRRLPAKLVPIFLWIEGATWSA
jgi:hypothetical protein